MCVNPFNWPRYLQQYSGGSTGGSGGAAPAAVPEMYKRLYEEHMLHSSQAVQHEAAAGSAAAGAATAAAAAAAAAALAGQAGTGGREAIQREVEAALMEVLGSALPPDEPLMSGGPLGA